MPAVVSPRNLGGFSAFNRACVRCKIAATPNGLNAILGHAGLAEDTTDLLHKDINNLCFGRFVPAIQVVEHHLFAHSPSLFEKEAFKQLVFFPGQVDGLALDGKPVFGKIKPHVPAGDTLGGDAVCQPQDRVARQLGHAIIATVGQDTIHDLLRLFAEIDGLVLRGEANDNEPIKGGFRILRPRNKDRSPQPENMRPGKIEHVIRVLGLIDGPGLPNRLPA